MVAKNMQDQMNTFNSVVKGNRAKETDPQTELSNYWINRSEEILDRTKTMDTAERNMIWRRETEGWSGWAGNREYRAMVEDTLSPLPDKEAKEERKKYIGDSLVRMSHEDRDFWFKDEAHKQPSYVLEHIEPMFDTTTGILDGKNLEHSRINQTFEIDNLMSTLDLSGLNPDVANEIHEEHVRLGIINGYTELSVDDAGFISVPMDGKLSRAMHLPDSNNIPDSLISQVDWMPVIRRHISNNITKIRQDVIESDNTALRALRANISNPNIRPEHRKSIIADYAITLSDDPMKDVNKGIVEVLSADLKQGKYKSAKELANALFLFQDEVWNTLKERI